MNIVFVINAVHFGLAAFLPGFIKNSHFLRKKIDKHFESWCTERKGFQLFYAVPSEKRERNTVVQDLGIGLG